jgi:xylulokinase
MACIFGLDIGTTSTIGILIRLPDQVLGVASRPTMLRSPRPGWAEQDPREWWANACHISRQLLSDNTVSPDEVAAIGVTGMLPAVVLLDERDELIRPSIQQSDGRCVAELDALRAEVDESGFLARAGNGINQQLVACKLRWLEHHEPENFRRIATVLGSYDYINWRLTGERAIEQNWALEAGFVDLATHALADDLVALAHVRRCAIPPKVASHHLLGRVTAKAASQTGLAAGTPVVGGAADLIASALCAGVLGPGDMLIKFGGSIDVLVATDKIAPDARMYLDYHLVPGLFMPNGCMSTGGSGLNWFAASFAGGEAAAAAAQGLSLHQHLDRLAAAIPPGAEGVRVLPYFLGEKTPIHDPAARGVFSGLTLAHGLGHLWRALLEAYAQAVAHHVAVLNDMGHRTDNCVVSDGGSTSRLWMQIVADVLRLPLRRLIGHPGSCLGAAWTAAMGLGLADDWAGVGRFVQHGDLIEPDCRNGALYAQGYGEFRELYRCFKSLSAEPSRETCIAKPAQGPVPISR